MHPLVIACTAEPSRSVGTTVAASPDVFASVNAVPVRAR